MSVAKELRTIIARILDGSCTDADLISLRQMFNGAVASGDRSVAINGDASGATINTGDGNTILNIVFQADGIRIGEEDYQGKGAEILRSLLWEFLAPTIEVDWPQVSRLLLDRQVQRLTSNPLTHAEGIAYRTDQVYVPLGLVERKRPSRRRENVSPEEGSQLYQETEITREFKYEEFLKQVLRRGDSPRSSGQRLAIIGEPGAGKTTLLQQMGIWISEEIDNSVVIWVSLADLQGKPLENYLLEQWLQVAVQRQGKAEAASLIKDAFVAQFETGNVWLLLDGADEMQATSDDPLTEIERQIRNGGLLSQARVILTCRLNLWDGDRHPLDTFDTYRTLEFSYPAQVEQFIQRWFNALPDRQPGQADQLCTVLRQPGRERIQDLVKNPLRLTLLCFNWYLGEGALPKTKAGLYEQFVADFYEWKRKNFSTTASQRKQLTIKLGELARAAINRQETPFRLQQHFVCEHLGEPDEADSLFSLALKLGWLNQIGVDAQNPKKAVYAFFHPTFQEFFAAQCLLRLLTDLTDEQLKREYLNRLKWTESLVLMLAMVDKEELALRVVKLAMDEVDLILGSKLAGAVIPAFQKTTVNWIHALEVPLSLKIQCWETSHSELAVSELLHVLNHADHDLRYRAISALGKIGGETATHALLDKLACPDANVRRNAIEALKKIGNDAAIKSLLNRLLNDSDMFVQLATIQALVNIGSEQAITALYNGLDYLTSKDPVKSNTLREFAERQLMVSNETRELSKHQPTKEMQDDFENTLSIHYLTYALGNPGAPQRQRAVVAMGAAAASGKLDNDTLFHHLVNMLNDSEADVRRRVVKTLVKVNRERAIATFLDILSNPSSNLRQGAIEALGYSGGEMATAAVLKSLHDADRSVRYIAATALVKIGNKTIVPDLISNLDHPEPFIGARAAEALGLIGDDRAIPSLLNALHAEDEDVVTSVIGALGQLGNPLALPDLWRMYQQTVKDEVWRAIAAIQSQCRFYNNQIV